MLVVGILGTSSACGFCFYCVWVKREKGGGLVGTYPTKQEAVAFLEDSGAKVEDHEITQTQTHTLLKVDEATGNISEIPFLFDCASSKLRESRGNMGSDKQLKAVRAKIKGLFGGKK